MEFCNGTEWRLIGMPHLMPTSIGCNGNNDAQSYDSTNHRMVFCDNNNIPPTAPAPPQEYRTFISNINNCGVTSDTTGCNLANRGKQRYNVTDNMMQFCNGSVWVNMTGTSSQPCCPSGFIPVPPDPDPAIGVNYHFCVSKYHMKATHRASGNFHDGDGPLAANHFPESRPESLPWRRINYLNARAECESLGEGFSLITNREWMTVARNIENRADNWSGSAVGSGIIPTGHSDGYCAAFNTPAGCDNLGQTYLAASSNDAEGCFGTDNPGCLTKSSADGHDHWQKRTLTLSNGHTIWDFAGNINSWVDPDGLGSTISYTRAACDATDLICVQQLNSTYSAGRYPSFVPSVTTPTSLSFLPATNPGVNWDQFGLGTITFNTIAGQTTNRGLYRGGRFNETRAIHAPGDPRGFIDDNTTYDRRGGIYSAWVINSHASTFDYVGFRCVFRPY